MRRLLPLLLVCLALAVASCGGDDGAGGPLETSLSYLPKDTPFAVAVDTDLEGDQYGSAQAILDRFPGGIKIEALLRQELAGSEGGVDYEQDVKPLLGNPFVAGATDVTSFLADSEDDDFVAAIEVEDGEALDRVIEKLKPDEAGETAGATVYEDDGSFFAVDEDVVVFAGSRKLLESALERADAGEGLEASTFEDSLEDLPEQALLRIHFDVQELIAEDPDTEAARRVPWVAALRTLGMTVEAEDDGVRIDFNLRSDEEELDDGDLPLAPGDDAPAVVSRPGEIAMAVRDPSQMIAFFESAFQAVDPQGFGDYETGKAAIAQQHEIDVDKDLFGQMTGDLALSVAVDGSFGARGEVKNPDAFAATLDKVADALPQLGAGLGVTGVRPAGDLYEARLEGGGRFVFGVRDGVFVAADSRARALELAAASPDAVEGAKGSLVMSADAEEVGNQVLEQLGSTLGVTEQLGVGLFLRPLDQASGSVTTSTDGMRGSFGVTLD
jgi:hypothetical protein